MKTTSAHSRYRSHWVDSLTEFFSGRNRTLSSCLTPALFLAIVGLQGSIPSVALGGEADDIVAVYSSVSPDYTRTRLPDGSRKVETYAFGEGGRLGGGVRDETIDKLKFIDIARVLAPALAAKSYRPCSPKDPAENNLLIMVYWGTTVGTDHASSSPEYQIAQALIPPAYAPPPPPTEGQNGTEMVSDSTSSGRTATGQITANREAGVDSALQQSLMLSSMANHQRDRQNYENASLLGFVSELNRLQGFEQTPFNRRRQDVVEEVEESRYFVVLMAYDFQTIHRHKQRKLLWETRFSIREHRNDFSKQLAAMAQSASRFFGEDSNGLTHKPVGDGRVDYGELKIIGVVSEKK